MFYVIHPGELGGLACFVGGHLVFACRVPFAKGFLKCSLCDNPTQKLALLETLSVQVGKLQVDTLPRFRESVNNAARGMFQLHMPSLKYLNVKATADTVPTFNIEAKNMPALRVLELTNLIPRILAPLTSVIGFQYYPIRFNTRIFDQLPNLQHLVCDMPDIGVGWGSVVLPSLMHVTRGAVG